ncbi:hypothetical protein LBMAG53_36610 [Planctomycetota bacterium]|nr:hypothetical protein LBMAG53_36610 [Planctomycetota bacterium]
MIRTLPARQHARIPIIIAVILGLIVVVGINYAAWLSVATRPLPKLQPGELTWSAFAGISGTDGAWKIPAELRAKHDQAVTITGVLVPHPALRSGKQLLGALFAPPAKFSCCGLTCDPRPAVTMLVEFASPIPDPGKQRLARIHGVLAADGSATGWAATSLSAATVELLRDP